MLCSQMPAGTNGQQTLLQLQPAEIKGSERGRPANLTPELGEIDQRPQPATRRQVSKCSHQRLVTKWCVCSVAQSCLTLCDPMDCSPPGSSVHGDSPGKNTGGRCHALLQGIFPTQGSNPGLPLWRQILYRLSHQGSPFPHRRRPMMTACSFCPEILFVIEFKLMHLGFSRDLIISAAKNWHYITPIVTTFPPIDY